MARSKPQPKKPSLAETHPELAAQADGWDPTTLTAWSKEKVGWKCELGHTWVTSVEPRKKGSGCPYCAGQKPIVGLNDLATTHSELAAQADGWDPASAKAGTNKKMKWRCQRGHVWDASVSSRARLGSSCPVCSNQKVLSGFNDLATTHPELAAQADGWEPRTFIAGTNKKLLWRCSLGHNFTMSGNTRVYRGLSCPICSGQKILQGFNDLATTHPELATQLINGDPTSVSKGSDKKFLWRCESGHTWTTTVGSRTQGAGCPYCQGLLTIVGVNDLTTTHPELAAQADGWNPQNFKRGSASEKKSWQCHLGHKWKANISDRAIQGQGCPYCSGRRVLKGFNDIATTHADLAAQAEGWDPSTVTRGSEYKRRWKCELGHIWTAPVVNRTNNGNGCAVCAGKQINVGINDIATTEPEIAAEAYGWDPRQFTSHSSKKVKWKCEKDHIWTAKIANRSNGRGCPICGNKTVLAGFNDLITVSPSIAAEAYGWDPRQFTSHSSKKVKWKCEKDHIWTAKIANRSNGTGCPYCSHHKYLKGFNDLATTHPELAREAFGWDPSTLTHGSPKKVLWICDHGHKWKTSPNTRKQGKTGCPTCAKTGFDPNKSGWLYLVDHDEIAMFQIGISNFPENRLAEHKRRGWEVLEFRGPMGGHLTQKLEKDILHALEKRGAVLGHKSGIEKFDGYSEAWTKKSLNVTSIKQILDWVYEDDEIADE